jgi:hypothetical protein
MGRQTSRRETNSFEFPNLILFSAMLKIPPPKKNKIKISTRIFLWKKNIEFSRIFLFFENIFLKN